jgi:hypothetical protein
MDGDKPCCSPGSQEEHVAEVLDFIRVAEEWVNAVQETKAAKTKATAGGPPARIVRS